MNSPPTPHESDILFVETDDCWNTERLNTRTYLMSTQSPRPSAVAILSTAIFCLLAATATCAQEQVPRPPITGIARVEVYVSNAEKAGEFYEKLLGFTAASESCGSERSACLAVNSRQQIQLISATSPVAQDLIAKVTFATPDVQQMHGFLVSRGYAPDAVDSSATGAKSFSVRDPEGHVIGFAQSPARAAAVPAPGQISARLIHAGFIVKNRQAEDRFYKDVLGFHLYWQGGMKDDEVSWVSMQVPDGTDWLEYMLNISPDASAHVKGVMNHIAFGVTDIQAARERFVKNGGAVTSEPKLGRDGKWQLNLYDPDGTRAEFMEFTPREKPCCSPFGGEHPKP